MWDVFLKPLCWHLTSSHSTVLSWNSMNYPLLCLQTLAPAVHSHYDKADFYSQNPGLMYTSSLPPRMHKEAGWHVSRGWTYPKVARYKFFCELLLEMNQGFVVDKKECGRIDLVQMNIDTGDTGHRNN